VHRPARSNPIPSGPSLESSMAKRWSWDDGKVVRLIGALAPRARDANASPGAWPPEIDTIKALSDLVLAKKIKLAFAGRRADRYGRALAQVFLEDCGCEEWVQGTLLANGYARAYGLPESFGCARELLAHEAEARRIRSLSRRPRE
jgi:micrococcal nuclease